MKYLHLIFGLIVIVIFLLTGQYMDRYHAHLVGMADGPRMFYRSRHIYILLAGLINVGIGAYFSYRPHGWRRGVQLFGSVLLIIAPLFFVLAFFTEPPLVQFHTPNSRWAIYITFAGTMFHFFSGIGLNSKPLSEP